MDKKRLVHIKEFKVVDNYLLIVSKHNQQYKLSKSTCSCRGFAFRRSCGHFTEAKENDLLDLLIENKNEFKLSLNEHAKRLRKEAIESFLKKHNITVSQQKINLIETILTRETKPEEVLRLANERVFDE